jgi:hypothetical protein
MYRSRRHHHQHPSTRFFFPFSLSSFLPFKKEGTSSFAVKEKN